MSDILKRLQEQDRLMKKKIAANIFNKVFGKPDILHDILVKNDSASRKLAPIFEGFMRYFPNSMKAVACLSRLASEKHNGLGKFGWSWNRSDDHGDCVARHQLEPTTLDEFDLPHAVATAWRAMAQLEKLLVEKYKLELPPAAYMVPEVTGVDLASGPDRTVYTNVKQGADVTIEKDEYAGYGKR